MTIKIGFTDELVNTQYAPLAALCAHYQQNHVLEPLEQVQIPLKTRDFSPTDKLIQVMISILANCGPLYEVNPRLRSEPGLAAIWGWQRFADQPSLSRTLDALTLKQIEQLQQSSAQIWQTCSRVKVHDWRGYLWLDFDLSGLTCSPRAQESQKGYFSGKKTPQDVSWPGSVRSNIAKRSGQNFILATVDYGRPVRVFVKRRLKDGAFCHSYYVSSLTLPSKGRFMACYDNRGGAEVEQFRSDKSGLSLDVRRKHSFPAQKGFIFLTDLAHKLLADFYHQALSGTRFEAYGVKRIVRDLLTVPGRLVFEGNQLVRIDLLTLNQFAKDLAICLERYCPGD